MIELCNQFAYLGLLFNYNGIFTVTQKILSEQGKKATFSLLSKNMKIFLNTDSNICF